MNDDAQREVAADAKRDSRDGVAAVAIALLALALIALVVSKVV
jgi:Flp pilus assembly protein TadG